MFTEICKAQNCQVLFGFTPMPAYSPGTIYLPGILTEEIIDQDPVWRALALHELGHHVSKLKDPRMHPLLFIMGNDEDESSFSPVIDCEKDAWSTANDLSLLHYGVSIKREAFVVRKLCVASYAAKSWYMGSGIGFLCTTMIYSLPIVRNPLLFLRRVMEIISQ